MSNTTTSQLTMKRFEFWIALFALIGSLVTSIVALREQFKQRQALTDLEEMTRQAAMRPCEGEWRYTIEYGRFHTNTTDKFAGLGRAIMIWRPGEQSYDVTAWMSVTMDGKPKDELVTAVAQGSLKADRGGRPHDGASMPLTYSARTGKPPFEQASSLRTEYTKLKFDWSADGRRMEKIVAEFHTGRSDGVVTFQR